MAISARGHPIHFMFGSSFGSSSFPGKEYTYGTPVHGKDSVYAPRMKVIQT